MNISPDYSVVDNSYTKQRKGLAPVVFTKELIEYAGVRAKQLLILLVALFKLAFDAGSKAKSLLVRRMFWGRGSFYRTAFHLFVFTITITIVLTGVSSRLNIFAETTNGQLALNENIIGRADLIYQAGTAEALSTIDPAQPDFEVYKYVVQKGDSLASVAKLYSKNINTLVWANNLGNANAALKVSQVLRIPAIDGAYYTVKKGDTLEKIAKYTNSNYLDIWDLNSNVLDSENPVVAEGMELFVPNGIIPTPAPTAVRRQSSGGGSGGASSGGVIVPAGSFVHPLLHCSGWTWSRGFSSSHGGVDLGRRGGGCWENAIADGVVIKAGWGGWGYTTIIDHGGGLVSIYGHGTGQYAVKQGDHVKAGQDIMFMGYSGHVIPAGPAGTHLHLEMHTGGVNGPRVNPERYVKLR